MPSLRGLFLVLPGEENLYIFQKNFVGCYENSDFAGKAEFKNSDSVGKRLDKNSDFGYDIEKEGMMMFKRKIYNQLLQWKEESQGRTALLIEGARRVGKSTVVEEFGKNEYITKILFYVTSDN